MCDFTIEQELSQHGFKNICGVDEVGRGALFGPVVAGAVILDPSRLNYGIRDSKRLQPAQRLELSHDIYKNARAFSIGWCWNDEIDEINIVEATKKAMKMAVNRLQLKPDYILMDALQPDFLDVCGHGIIKGDDQSLSIAAASIIAKVFRDQLIVSLSNYFPGYSFENHKGYPTGQHIEALTSKGRTEFHRRSFRGV